MKSEKTPSPRHKQHRQVGGESEKRIFSAGIGDEAVEFELCSDCGSKVGGPQGLLVSELCSTCSQRWRSAEKTAPEVEPTGDPTLANLDARVLFMRAAADGDKEAALELLRRAEANLDYLSRLITGYGELLAEQIAERTNIPVHVSMQPQSDFYYPKVMKKLQKLGLGSATGLACSAQSKWRINTDAAAWASVILDVIRRLRNESCLLYSSDPSTSIVLRSLESDGVKQKFELIHKGVPLQEVFWAEEAQSLAPCSQASAETYVQFGLKILATSMDQKNILPVKPGRRKKGASLVDPGSTKFRDRFRASLRAMIVGNEPREKSHEVRP
jgi:hypothetical protein